MIILIVLLLNDSGIAQLTELLGGVCMFMGVVMQMSPLAKRTVRTIAINENQFA